MRCEKGPGWSLYHGDWRDVLDGVKCQAVITDPPYSGQTHRGASDLNDRIRDANRQNINYRALTASEIVPIAVEMDSICNGWIAVMTDDVLAPEWRNAYVFMSRYGFAPVPIVSHKVRLVGDGPASAAVYLMVCRPKEKRFLSWGALPGWYKAGIDRTDGIIGNKPLDLMRAIVRDYSKPGDLICDPYAGSGTTLLAAVMEGRRAVGAEVDRETFSLAVKRLKKGYTPDLFGG